MTEVGAQAVAAPALAHARTRHRLLLPVLLVGTAMAAMDTSIVNVAAPALRADLGISGALLQMVIAGYVLAYAVLLVTCARLGDDYGYRRLLVVGLAIFTAASLVCGLAPETASLIVARVVQGIGAALMIPQVLSLIQREFEGSERARAVGSYSMILAVGVTAGQLLGGVIVTVDIFGSSWRPAFLVNVPIGLLLLLCAGSVLPESRGEIRRRLDVAGVLALSVSMILIVVPLTFGREVDWAAWTLLSLGLGVVGLVGFVFLERAVLRRGGSPLLDLAVFVPGVRAGLLVVSIGFVGYGGFLFAMALYLQSGLGFSAIESGLVFVAYSIGFGAANLSWARLPAPLLRWTPTAALGAMAAAVAVFGLVAVRAGWTPAAMLPLLLVAGSGHGFAFGPVVNRMAARIPPAQGPALSGLVASATQLSIVLGVASLGTVYLAKAEIGSAGPSSDAIGIVAFAIAGAAAVAVALSIELTRRR